MNRREYVGTCMPSLPDIVDLTGLCIGRHCHVFHIVYFCVLISKIFLSEKSEPNVSFKFTQRVLDIDYNFYLFVFFFIFLFLFFFPTTSKLQINPSPDLLRHHNPPSTTTPCLLVSPPNAPRPRRPMTTASTSGTARNSSRPSR